MTAPPPPSERVTITAFFTSAPDVERAVIELGMLGVPRDLVDVAATRETARRHYGRRGAPHGRRAGRLAAIGALGGLLVGIGISLLLVLLPGEPTGTQALVQLLGPNFSTTAGAVLGAAYGAVTARAPLGVYERLRERTDALLLVIRQFPAAEAERLRDLLVSWGGSDVAWGKP